MCVCVCLFGDALSLQDDVWNLVGIPKASSEKGFFEIEQLKLQESEIENLKISLHKNQILPCSFFSFHFLHFSISHFSQIVLALQGFLFVL